MKSNFTCIKKMPVYLLSASFCLGMFSCQDDVRTDGYSTKDVPELHALSAEQKEVIDYTPKKHRHRSPRNRVLGSGRE